MDRKFEEPIRHTEYRYKTKQRIQMLDQLKKEQSHEKVFMNDFVKLQKINDSINNDLDNSKTQSNTKQQMSRFDFQTDSKIIGNSCSQSCHNSYNPEIFILPPIQKYDELLNQNINLMKSVSTRNIDNNHDNSFISFTQLKNQNNQKVYKKFPNLNYGQESLNETQNDKNMTQEYKKYLDSQDSVFQNDMTNRKNVFIQGVKYNKKQQQKINESCRKQMMINYFQAQKNHFDNQKLKSSLPVQKSCETQVQVSSSKPLTSIHSNQKSILTTSKDQNKTIIKQSQSKTEGQKKTKKVTLLSNYSHGFNVYFKTVYNQKWKPEVRENSDFVIDQIRMKGYLIFGLGTDLYNDIIELDFKNYRWSRLNQSGDQSKSGRCSHNSIYHNKSIYTFGGETLFNPSIKQRECLSDLRQLKLDIDIDNQNEDHKSHKWKLVRTYGEIIEGRRNHAGCCFYKYMLISGGINNKNNYMNDYWVFDINTHIWMKLNVNNHNSLSNMAFHQIQAVFHESRTKLAPGKFLPPLEETVRNFIVQEGIYVFGGKTESSGLQNRLMILKFDSYPMDVIYPQTQGNPPQGRYGHRMKYISTHNLLVIHGGINDQNGSKLSYLNDMFVLNVSNLTWINVQCLGQQVQERAFFQMEFISNINKLIIFGGISPKGYQTNDIVEVEIDQTKIKVLSQDGPQVKIQKVETKQESHMQIEQQNDDFQQYLENLNYKNFVTYLPKPKTTSLNVFQKEVKRISNLNSIFNNKLGSLDIQQKAQMQIYDNNTNGNFSKMKKSVSQAINNINKEDRNSINVNNIQISDQSQTPLKQKKLNFDKLNKSKGQNQGRQFASMAYI